MWKNVHSVYGAGIRTYNLLYMSRLPEPLDQGSRPEPNIAVYDLFQSKT